MNIGFLLSIVSITVILIVIAAQLRVIMQNRRSEFPTLKKGEKYAGILLGKNGEPDRHIILLPGAAESVNLEDAKKFAESIGGELPTRRMQSLLYANLKEEFQPVWHWSGEQREAGSAWIQLFSNGHQYWYDTSYECRAVAVRSVPI